ncbi:hypothetical protein BOS5A_211391 [Bosea sp. EC-HK365B]|nr:hypothetical protein BOSE21B_50300 [Bosea sp. 21B]CAD5301346.1 hypothetical protein BOSE7B_90390 [Bosea sp. 7B]VVT60600.1 hypothetical protein BOS5A_211391 [Bosea sp. EC-HK365B]VXB67701.1 hypothetical protein BOSE127_140329 [Bosea sp. 127]
MGLLSFVTLKIQKDLPISSLHAS